MVGQGVGVERTDHRHPAQHQRREREHARRRALVARVRLDLYLVDPRGNARASSISIPSVFERARVAGAIVNGTWKLRIRGYRVSSSQTVYWAAHVRLA